MHKIRELRQDEQAFLQQMLYHCLYVPSGQPAFDFDIVHQPEISRYIDHWGLPNDRALVATMGDAMVGAAWFRQFSADSPGYGFVDADIPEVSMAVLPNHRGNGIGTALLKQLIMAASNGDYPALSLSVDRRNPAHRLYERLGFVQVDKSGHAITMVLKLRD